LGPGAVTRRAAGGQARPAALGRGERGRRRSGENAVARVSIFELSVSGHGNAQAGSGAGGASGHGQAQRAVAHSELFIGRFVEELNAPGKRSAASSRGIRRRMPDFRGLRTRAHSDGRFTMEAPPLLAAARAMTSAAGTAVSPSSGATRTRTPARALPARRARARSRGRARRLASSLLGGVAGLVAAAVFAAVAPAVGRGGTHRLDRAAPRDGALGRHRAPAASPVAWVLVPATATGPMPDSDAAEAGP